MTDSNEPVARIPLVPPGTEHERASPVFDAFMKSRGKVPNLFRAAAHQPAIVDTLHAHMGAVMGAGTVSVLLKELLSIRVSQINLCEY